ncbi:MAG: class I SAM-dependent methyltransferase [Gemmataceae bacterium]
MPVAAPVASLTDLADVPYARGYVERVKPLYPMFSVGGWNICLPGRYYLRPHGVKVAGWMLLADGPFDRIAAYVNGTKVFGGPPYERPDVGAAFPHILGAERVGFNFKIAPEVARRGRLTIVGQRKGRPAGKMLLDFRDDLIRTMPVPPPDLMNRVVFTRDPHFFLAQGYKSFGEIREALVRHKPLESIGRLLDWGCGCGRLTAHWLRLQNGPEVHGCDIDPEAIAWCRRTLRRGHFERVAFAPPTPYPDGHFDAIFGYSVLTHLTREAQHSWLAEMRRILAPGGVLVATVHGPSAAWFQFGKKAAAVLQGGIHDAMVDCGLDALLGKGVYRNTFQTPTYTCETFGRHFDVLEYVEQAIGNNQDLVVLRK